MSVWTCSSPVKKYNLLVLQARWVLNPIDIPTFHNRKEKHSLPFSCIRFGSLSYGCVKCNISLFFKALFTRSRLHWRRRCFSVIILLIMIIIRFACIHCMHAIFTRKVNFIKTVTVRERELLLVCNVYN